MFKLTEWGSIIVILEPKAKGKINNSNPVFILLFWSLWIFYVNWFLMSLQYYLSWLPSILLLLKFCSILILSLWTNISWKFKRSLENYSKTKNTILTPDFIEVNNRSPSFIITSIGVFSAQYWVLTFSDSLKSIMDWFMAKISWREG